MGKKAVLNVKTYKLGADFESEDKTFLLFPKYCVFICLWVNMKGQSHCEVESHAPNMLLRILHKVNILHQHLYGLCFCMDSIIVFEFKHLYL